MATAWQLLKTTASRWDEHNAPRLGAALAYYTVLSIAPLLVLVVAIVAFAFGEKAARGEIAYQVESLVGRDVGQVIQELLKAAHRPSSGITATVIGTITLFIGASAVFGELRDALNLIWEYKTPVAAGFKGMLRFRLFTFTIVIAVGFLLLVSLVVSAGLAFLTKYLQGHFAMPGFVAIVIEPVISILIITLLFALIYKYIPDIHVEWRDVWLGAAFTAVAFTVGKLAIGFYLGKAGVGSAYGAAGSLVVLLVWVYYSSQIFFFGAEFTKVYSDRRHNKLAPAAS